MANSQRNTYRCGCSQLALAGFFTVRNGKESKMDSIQLINEMIDHFQSAGTSPNDCWASPDDMSSFGLDHQSPDGTKFWIDFERDGSIILLWKPAGESEPNVIKFIEKLESK